MDIRQLRYFLQVYRHGSILQASQHVFISQQALSKTISSLEQEIGVPLFYRTPRGLTPTEIGRQLYQLAIPVVQSMDTLVEQVSLSAKLSSSQVTIGIVPGMQFFLSSQAIARLSEQFPTLDIRVEEHSYDKCEAMVADGTLTAALVSGPVINSRLVVMSATRRLRVALLPKHSPLAGRQQLHIRDMKGQKLAINMNTRDFGVFCELCHNEGFEPDAYHLSDNITMMDFCDQDGYIGFWMDFLLLRNHPAYNNLIALPMDPSEFSYSIDVIVNPVQHNRKIIQDLCQEIRSSILAQDQRVPQFPFIF